MTTPTQFLPRSLAFRPWVRTTLFSGLLFATAFDWSRGAEPADVPATTRAQVRALQLEKASRTRVQRKLDSQLIYALKLRRGEPIAPGVDRVKPSVRLSGEGRLLVDIKAEVTPALLEIIRQAGGTVINSFAQHRSVRAELSLEGIERLVGRNDVQQIRPADEATTHAVTEGDITHRVSDVRNAYKVRGAGVKIGVLSDSVDYLGRSQDLRELPHVTILPGQFGGGNGEGTAMLEIVHDLAPDAELYFATAFTGQANFAQNIRALFAAGCRVIVDDVIYFAESPFQDSLIAQAVNEVSAGGALYFSAAGNSGNKDDNTAGTWEGDFADGGPATPEPNGGRFHDFGGTTFNTILPGGALVRVDLFWSDPLGHSTNDYDVYLVDSDGSIVRSSTNIQDGDDDPYENIPFVEIGQRVVIVKASGEDRFLHLDTGRASLSVSTSGNVRGHNASGASNAFSVAATWVKQPAVPFVGGVENPVELFSSDGPRRMFFNADGTPITPDNFSSTGGVVLRKPDLVAADGVATSIVYFNPFFGTSAAAPHAAAIAALLLSYNPSLSPQEVRSALEGSALDIETPGVDRNSGVGIIMAPASLLTAPPPPPRLFFGAAAVRGGNGNASLDPNEFAEMFITLENIITPQGMPASGVIATLATTTPGVATDPTPRTFIDIPAAGSGTNFLPFFLSTTPSFLCGTVVDLQLSVTTANAGSFLIPFQIASTAPGVGAGVVFDSPDGPVVVPDLSTIESSTTVSGLTLPIGNVTVSLHAQHPYASDLAFTLIGPDGTSVELSSGNGGSASNYGTSCSSRTVFDDHATASILVASAPFVGVFQPEQSLSAFSLKSGSSANGVWRLRVSDQAEADTGILNCWSLTVAPIACLDGGGGGFTAPLITAHPASSTVPQGGTAVFSVEAEGTPTLQYQWYFNATNQLIGATNSTVELPGVTAAMAGTYHVTVSNLYGVAVSDPASLEVVNLPEIVQHPSSLTATNGGTAALTVVAQGSEPLTYQWYRAGSTPLPGATNAILLFNPVSTNDDSSYFAIASNPYGQATSSVATLTVVVPPFLLGQPLDATVATGETVVFSVSAGGTAPLSYQWFFNETNALSGGTNASLMLSGVTAEQAGGYSVAVSNPYGTVSSREAVLEVETASTNQPPLITLTSPAAGSIFTINDTPIILNAAPSDPDGTVTEVAFYANGIRLATTAASPWTFAWMDPGLGTHQLWATARDDRGGLGTSLVAQVTVQLGSNFLATLISTGAVWKYNDSGANLGTAWTGRNYDDSAWLQGPAELGYGDSQESRPEATVVSYGPDPQNKHRTTYFRRSFVLTDTNAFKRLRVRLLRDDGAVVHLNGIEIWRNNLGSGSIAFTNLALQNINGPGEYTFLETNLSANLLANGSNVVAVEIHQVSPSNNDISFDLGLQGERSFEPRIVSQPQDVEVDEGVEAQFSVLAAGAPPLRYQWHFSGAALPGETNALLQVPGVSTAVAGPYFAIVTNSFGSVTSRVATLAVRPPPNDPPLVALTSPAPQATFEFGQPILLTATASDPDGHVGSVQFFGNGGLLAQVVSPPFGFNWLNALPGSNFLFAVALDDRGLAVTSSVVSISVSVPPGPVPLIAAGSVWKYLDDGSDQGVSWTGTTFNDSAWPSGPAQLGFGDGDEQTVLEQPPGPTVNHLTFYFRHTFAVGDPSIFPSLLAFYRRDDGIVVHLNGVEVFRNNMPTGTVTFATPAAGLATDDGNDWFTNSIPSSRLISGRNVLAAEIHQSTMGNPDISFDLGLIARTQSTPPAVVITSPIDQTNVPASTLFITANATDADAPIANVTFFDGVTRIGEDSTAPYSVVWSNIAVGVHTLHAVALSEDGDTADADPVTVNISPALVPLGSGWRYLADGTDQATAWREPAFDDSLWATGLAELGYGDGDEVTVIDFGPDPDNKYRTAYFRHRFATANPAAISNVVLGLVRDAGAVAYLNGVEIFRSNMPTGLVEYSTFASNAVDETSLFYSAAIDSSLLVDGTNVLAVEVHQSSTNGIDLSFNAVLVGDVPGGPPLVAINSPTNQQSFLWPANVLVSVSAVAPGGGYVAIASVHLLLNGHAVGSTTDAPYQFTLTGLDPGRRTISAVAIDTAGLASTSAPVTITLLAPSLQTTLVATGSVWAYLDTGIDQGTAWRGADFDDSAWPTGPAELGYGDDVDGWPEATVLSFGPDPQKKYPTYYFRHAFVIDNPSLYSGLSVRLLRDDGAVVYLNSNEVFRSNMPEGEILFDTFAAGTVSRQQETEYLTSSAATGFLNPGSNLLAVEVHQVNGASLDLSFDLEVLAELVSAPFIEEQPLSLSVVQGESAQLTVHASGAAPLSYQWFHNANPIQGGSSNTLDLINIRSDQAGVYHVEVSNAAGTTRSDLASLTVVVPPSNAPPVIALVAPTNGAVFAEGAVIELRAEANDPDGAVAAVTFFEGSDPLAIVTAAPYVFDWIDAPVGAHTLTARVIDNQGSTTTSGPISVEVVSAVPNPGVPVTLIPTNAVWKYLDTGIDQGTAWRDATYDDSAWAQGPAELGYGDAVEGRPEATVIQFGGDPENKFPTAYFRRAFLVEEPNSLSDLRLRLLRDDGAVVYLNGVEIFRSNLPKGDILFDTLAVTEIVGDGETTFLETNVPAALLTAGLNLLAVEIHQVSPGSSDLSFDFELTGVMQNAPSIISQPEDQNLIVGATARFEVVAVGASPLHYQWYLNSLTPLPNATNSTLVISNVQPLNAGVYSVTVTNEFGTAESSPAILRVLSLPIILTQPQTVTVHPGQPAALFVEAESLLPLRYQWFFNGATALEGKTNSVLQFPAVQASDFGEYLVAVSNDAGTINSETASLRVLVPAQITEVLLTPGVGTNVTFTSLPGLIYTLEFNTNLSEVANWPVVTGASKLRATNYFMTIPDPSATPAQRVYRVKVD